MAAKRTQSEDNKGEITNFSNTNQNKAEIRCCAKKIMRYMDRGNYIKRNGYCSTISCETKGQKKWWKKIERQNGRWNGNSGRKICECRWLVSEMLNTITIDSFNLFVLFKYCIENKFVDAF